MMTKCLPRANEEQQEHGYDLDINEIHKIIEQSKAHLVGHPVSPASAIETQAIILAMIDLGYIS